MSFDEHLDHEAAYELAQLKHASNLARCYLDMRERAMAAESRLETLERYIAHVRAHQGEKAE